MLEIRWLDGACGKVEWKSKGINQRRLIIHTYTHGITEKDKKQQNSLIAKVTTDSLAPPQLSFLLFRISFYNGLGLVVCEVEIAHDSPK